MKKFFIIILVLIGLILGTSYFYFLKTLTPDSVPTRVLNAEEAMSTSGTIAIASIDMRYVRRIDKVLKAGNDPSPLIKAKPAKTLLDKLTKKGINLFSATDNALATINIAKEKPAFSFVLFGRFKGEAIKKVLYEYYLVDESTKKYWLLDKLPEQEKKVDPCVVKQVKKSAPKQLALHIQKDRIILTTPELMPTLLKRFKSKARAEVSLTKWRQFRKGKVLAGGVMSPKNANKGAVDLSSALLLGAISKQPLKEIYGGAVVSLLPAPGVKIHVDAHSNETAWPLKMETSYAAWLSEAVSDLQDMPTLASIIKSLKVKADGNTLRIHTLANKQTLDNFEKIPSEFFNVIFSQISFGNKQVSNAEKIVKKEDVEKYARSFDFSTVKPFDAKGMFYVPDYIVGPFAVRLKKMGLLATDDSVIELNINVEGKGFENLSGESMHKSENSSATSLLITRVEDNAGNDVLREELCGKSRNHVAEPLTSMRDKQFINGEWVTKAIKVSGNQSVRLKKNVPLSSVTKIAGKIVVRAGTRTKVQVLQSPFYKKIIKTNKVRMYFRKSNANTVKYDLSGDMQHIMAIRAKNAKGQYLASASGSATSSENTKKISKTFKGKIASIEVIVAEKMESKEYPFVINKIIPRYGKPVKGTQRVMSSTFKKTFLRKHAKVKFKGVCKDKQEVSLGNFVVCLNKFGDRWGRETGGEFDVFAPDDDALQNDLAAGMLSINSVITDRGEKIAFDKNETFDFDYKFDTSYNKKKKEWEITNRRLQASYINVYSDKEELKNKTIKTVEGTLSIRIANNVKYIQLGATELGVVKKGEKGIKANVAAFEDWNTYVDIQGPADKILRIMPLSKNGIILKTDNDRITEKKYRTWGLSEKDKKKIESLPKKWQGIATIYGKPDVIRIYYADRFEVIKRPFKIIIKQ